MLIDSNILVYALNDASPKQAKAQAFLQNNIGQGIIAHQNIFEAIRVLTHKKFPSPMSSDTAVTALSNIIDNFHVIAPEQGTHYIALAFVQKHSLTGDKIFDAYLAATALYAGIKIVATDNTKDLHLFEGIEVINPFN